MFDLKVRKHDLHCTTGAYKVLLHNDLLQMGDRRHQVQIYHESRMQDCSW